MSFRLERLLFGYDGKPVFDGLSLEIPTGGVTAILGPSGSGKTTLLSLLSLLHEPTLEPRMIVLDTAAGPLDYAAFSSADRDRLRGRSFGFVLQSCYLLPYLTCRENVALPLELQGMRRAAALAEADRLIVAADIAEAAARRPDAVSQGQKQRFAVLRAIVHQPTIVFADEPTSNLDSANTVRMLGLLRAWQRAGTIEQPRSLVFVSHDLETAHAMADRFVVLEKGVLQPEPPRSAVALEIPTAPADAAAPKLPAPRRPRLPLFARLAWRDLLDRRHRWTGLAILGTVIAMTLLTLIALAWPAMAESNRIAALAKKPLSNLLFVLPYRGEQSQPIPTEAVRKLEMALTAALGPQLVSVQPVGEVVLEFPERGQFYGRTVSGPDDPLVRSLTLRAGRCVDGSESLEIMVGPQLLEALAIPLDRPMPLTVRTLGPIRQVEIVGIVNERLPQGALFLLSSSTLRRMEREIAQATIQRTDLHSKPLSEMQLARWTETSDDGLRLREAFVEVCRKESLSVELGRSGDARKLVFRSNKRSVALWREAVARIAADLELDLDAVTPDLPEPTWNGVTVQVRDLPALPTAVRVVQESGLYVNETVAGQLLAYGESATEARRMLGQMLYLMYGVVALNLLVVQVLRLRRKEAEIALQRAIGMRRRQLDIVYLSQAFGIWLVGVGFGGGAALLLLRELIPADLRATILDESWQRDSLKMVIGMLIVLAGTAWAASRFVAADAPAERLTGG